MDARLTESFRENAKWMIQLRLCQNHLELIFFEIEALDFPPIVQKWLEL
jgi:hypothetical protein